MRVYSIYICTFLSFLLFLNCAKNEKKTTPDTSKTEVKSEVKDTVATTIEELEAAKKTIPHHYICYTNDDKSSMKIFIAFNESGNALFIKYKGQENTIPLQNIKEDFQNGGAYPTITQFYNEMYEGKINGKYELTHSGNWDYATYRPANSDKVVKFTIDHDATIVGDTYRKTPCF